MVPIGCDQTIIIGESSFHPLSYGFLSIIEVTETSDLLRLVEVVSSDLGPSHNGHVFEVLHHFFFSGSGLSGHLRLL